VYAGDETVGVVRCECQAFPFFIEGLHRQPALDDSFMHNAVIGVYSFEQQGPKTGTARTVETIGFSVAMPYQMAPDGSAAQRAAMRSVNA